MDSIPLDKKQLIIRLLIEDYRFQQITHRMRQINFHFDQSLDLMGIIADLMYADNNEPDLLWLHNYAEGLEEAFEAEFWNTDALRHIAQTTFLRMISASFPLNRG